MKELKPLEEFKELKEFILENKCGICGYEYEKTDCCPKCKKNGGENKCIRYCP
jgi:hypothetical protein